MPQRRNRKKVVSIRSSFNVGDVILGKVTGHAFWPAIIAGQADKKYYIKFFGCDWYGYVFPSKMLHINTENARELLEKLRARSGYEKAIKEMLLHMACHLPRLPISTVNATKIAGRSPASIKSPKRNRTRSLSMISKANLTKNDFGEANFASAKLRVPMVSIESGNSDFEERELISRKTRSAKIVSRQQEFSSAQGKSTRKCIKLNLLLFVKQSFLCTILRDSRVFSFFSASANAN